MPTISWSVSLMPQTKYALLRPAIAAAFESAETYSPIAVGSNQFSLNSNHSSSALYIVRSSTISAYSSILLLSANPIILELADRLADRLADWLADWLADRLLLFSILTANHIF